MTTQQSEEQQNKEHEGYEKQEKEHIEEKTIPSAKRSLLNISNESTKNQAHTSNDTTNKKMKTNKNIILIENNALYNKECRMVLMFYDNFRLICINIIS